MVFGEVSVQLPTSSSTASPVVADEISDIIVQDGCGRCLDAVRADAEEDTVFWSQRTTKQAKTDVKLQKEHHFLLIDAEAKITHLKSCIWSSRVSY
jgi:hypothetical protein